MIITCPSCNTKFNIDEKKLQGKSVKLKCSRCNNVFTPSLEPPEQPVIPEDILGESTRSGVDSAPEPPQNEDFSAPSTEGQPMDDALKSAIDEALKEFQSAESTGATASSDVDFGEEVKPENEILGDINFSVREEPKKDEEFIASGFDLKPEDILGGTKSEIPTMEGFESTKIESTEKPPEEPDLIGDLELELGGKSAQPSDTSPVSVPEIKEDDFGIEVPSRTPPPAAPVSSKAPSLATPRTPPVIKKAPEIHARVVPARNLLSYFLFIMIVIASLVLGFIYKDDLLSLLNPRSALQTSAKSFTVVSSDYYFLQNVRGQTLFVVEGKAKNITQKNQSFLKLKATLKDQDGAEVANKEFYAGNLVSDDSLRTDPAPVVEERFNNKVGDALANMNIKPGDVVPFMVVFYDIPNVSSYSIEVLSSEEIH